MVDSNWQKVCAAIGAKAPAAAPPAPCPSDGSGGPAQARPRPKTKEEHGNIAFVKADFPPSERNKGVYPDAVLTKFLGVDCEMVL